MNTLYYVINKIELVIQNVTLRNFDSAHYLMYHNTQST